MGRAKFGPWGGGKGVMERLVLAESNEMVGALVLGGRQKWDQTLTNEERVKRIRLR